MKIILLKDIPKIGHKNDIKDIADGYALNFIIPRGLGVKATEVEMKKIEGLKFAEETQKKIQEDLLKKSLDEISTITVTITEKANEKGHLFEGIHKERLAQEIEHATGIKLSPDYIELPKPIKELGEFLVPVSALGKKGRVKIIIEPIQN